MISIIAAIGKNRELGKDNKLLWDIPEDMKRFRALTSGHPIIMGRKTFESIGRVLPNRLNVVITRDPKFEVEGIVVARSLEEALDISSMYYVVGSKYEQKRIHDTSYILHATSENEIFIIGGGQIFEQALPVADKLYLTIIDKTFDADVFFPEYGMFTKVLEKEDHKSEAYKYSFITLQKEVQT